MRGHIFVPNFPKEKRDATPSRQRLPLQYTRRYSSEGIFSPLRANFAAVDLKSFVYAPSHVRQTASIAIIPAA